MIMGFLMVSHQQQLGMVDEEERLLQKAIEESKQSNPNQNPDPDNMSYEQLLELGDRVGKVSKGLSKEKIQNIPVKFWRNGSTKQNSCTICYEDFTLN